MRQAKLKLELQKGLWLQDTGDSQSPIFSSNNNALSGSWHFIASFLCLVCCFNNLHFLKDQPKTYMIHNASEYLHLY